MAEENLENVSGTEVEDSTQDYLAAIKELKQNSVGREEYEKLRAENKKLIEAVVNGQESSEEESEQVVMPTPEEINSLRKALYSEDATELTNIQYVEKTLALRDALIKMGEPDPFLPASRKFAPTRDDIDAAEKCATVYQECIDYAQGDSEAFTTELMRRTRDVRIR